MIVNDDVVLILSHGIRIIVTLLLLLCRDDVGRVKLFKAQERRKKFQTNTIRLLIVVNRGNATHSCPFCI